MSYKKKYSYEGQDPIEVEDHLSWFKGYHKGQGISALICQYKLVVGPGESAVSKKNEMDAVANFLDRLARVEHKNVARVYEVHRQDNALVIVQEDCEMGTLKALLKNDKFIDEKLALFITKQIATGLHQLHRLSIPHSYINLENIELDSSGTWKLSARSLVLKTFYLSPEFKTLKVRERPGDIFSLGMAFYKMMFGIFPFTGKDDKEIIENVKKASRRTGSVIDAKAPFPIVISKQTQALVMKMIKYERDLRPETDGLVAQITEILKDDLKLRKLPTEFTSNYISFGISDPCSDNSYVNQIFISIVNKRQGQFRRAKIVNYNSMDTKPLEVYRQHLSQFSGSADNDLVQVREYFETKGAFIIVYEYFNQATLEDYLALKAQLKKELIDDEKIDQVISSLGKAVISYQESGQAHTWLTPNRIYIKNGKAKIAEPALETEEVRKKLYTRKDDTDSVAPEKKKSRGFVPPSTSMDTWSLGALYYHMLYGQEPSFNPDGALTFLSTRPIKPTQMQRLSFYLAPDPKQRKSLIELDPLKSFTMEPTKIRQSRARNIQNVETSSQNLMSSVTKKTQSKLRQPRRERTNSMMSQSKKSNINEMQSIEKLKKHQPSEQVIEDEEEDDDCFEKNCQSLAACISMQNLDEIGFFDTLTESWSRRLRYVIKIFLCLAIYIPLFYLAFFSVSGSLLTNRNFYQSIMVTTRRNVNDTVPTVNYTIVTMEPSYFTPFYNTTLDTLKVNMNCVRDNYYNGTPYNDIVYVNQYIKSSGFIGFQVFGFFLIIISLILKGIQICKLDFCRTMYEMKKVETNRYSKVLSYVFVELAMASFISVHYLLYGSLYHMVLTPCLKNPPLPSVQRLFSGWVGTFILVYIWQFIGLVIFYVYVVYATFFLKKKEVATWIWILLLLLYIAGLGSRGLGGFVKDTPYDTVVSLFGVCGELLELFTILVCAMVDGIFWRCFKGKSKKISNRSKIRIAEESNATFQNQTENNEIVI